MGDDVRGHPRALPSGTVTFLFTDIEGSTRRWEVHGDAMASCISRHDEIVRGAVEVAGGVLVKSIGDGAMAVFDGVGDALDAALAAQVAMAAEDWSPVPALRVRMGVHTGWCEPTGDDYFGPVVNRAARIADAGNGGQILLSSASAAVVETGAIAELVSRGSVRLKDMAEPVELFQVLAPGLDNELLTLRTLDDSVADLPLQRTTFVGRDDELRRTARGLETGRLVTLVGLGGIGKTRLATQVGAELSRRFGGGVRFVDLAEVDHAGDVAAAMLDQLTRRSAVGSRGDAVEDPIDGVIRTLAGTEALVIVDNCEHVAEHASRVVDDVLANCHEVRVLATSREPLYIPGEQVVHLSPLSLPGDEGDAMSSAAVRLFVERAVAGGARAPDAAELESVAEVCELVDGLPLGIELAAARSVHLPLQELIGRLRGHAGVLVGRDRTQPHRHHTIDGLLAWSFDLLEPPAQLLLARLGMFAGLVDLDAVEAACSDDRLPRSAIVEHLGALVDRSLVAYDQRSGTYGLLNLVRGFARDRLEALGEVDWQERHARWCVACLEEVDGAETDDALAGFMQRHSAEVAAATTWATGQARTELCWSLAGGAWRWYEMTGRLREGLDIVERALAAGPPSGTRQWASAASGAASLAMVLGDVGRAQELQHRAEETFAALGDVRGQAWARLGLAMALMLAGDTDAAREADAARRAFADEHDLRGVGHAHASLGIIAARREDPETAETNYLEALSTFRRAGQRRDAASVLSNLGNLAQDRKDLLRASRYYDGALQLYREIGDHRGAGLILNNLCIVAQAREHLDRADELAREAIGEFSAINDRQGAAAARHNLANLAAEEDDPDRALEQYQLAVDGFRQARDPRGVITVLSAAIEVSRRTGRDALAWRFLVDQATVVSRLGLQTATQRTLRALAASAVAADEPELATRLNDAAESMIGDEISRCLELARTVEPPDRDGASGPRPPRTAPQSDALSELTTRERELLAAVGTGKTNAEIAEALFISRRTVDAHLSHIRTKLGVSDRSKLIVLAREHTESDV